ncbi:hypothetical protein D9M71_455760 [compost metagenome]
MLATEQCIEAFDQLTRWLGVVHAVAAAAGTAQEDEQGAANMAVIIVVRQPRAQLAVQGQQVQHILQVVAVLKNRLFHGHGIVGLDVRTQPVGLVVGHVVTPVQLERQVDEPFEHAV